jgi:branched-chain amino acid transport system permease protein
LGELVLQVLLSGVILGAIYGLIGIGFSVFHSATGAINFAQGEFVVLGSFLAISLAGIGLPTPLAILISSIMLALAAGIFFLLFLKKLAEEPVYLVVATVALSLTLRTVALYFWGREPLGLPSIFKKNLLAFKEFSITYDQLLIFATGVFLYFQLLFLFRKTAIGKAIRAIMEDSELAQTSGLNPVTFQSFSFSLAAFLGALSGGILSPVSMLSYFSGGLLGLKGFTAAVIGGLEKPEAAFAGGIVLGIIESLATYFFPSGFKDLIALFILLLVLALKPEGLLVKGVSRKA